MFFLYIIELTAAEIINLLQLEPLEIEGGYYRRNYLADQKIAGQAMPARYRGASRSFGSAIYYLLTPDTWSRIHRLPGDEIYHFYSGASVTLYTFGDDGEMDASVLGMDLKKGYHPQIIVPANTWQACRITGLGDYALMGTTMAPAFDEADFERPDDLDAFLLLLPDSTHDLVRELW